MTSHRARRGTHDPHAAETARTLRLAVAILANLPPEPKHLVERRRAELARIGGVKLLAVRPGGDTVQVRGAGGVWRWVPDTPTTPEDDHTARLLAGITREPR